MNFIAINDAQCRPSGDPRYPIGKFRPVERLDADEREEAIEVIAATPASLRAAVADLSAEQLRTRYRDGGWTLRQVVHHLADSHLNAYVRCKLTLTEDDPVIRAYYEDRWAELPDAADGPVELSLRLLDSLHERWVLLLRSLRPADFARTLRHPEVGPLTLDSLVAQYAWHGPHHIAHITTTREREGW